jgi:hypothetical protein
MQINELVLTAFLLSAGVTVLLLLALRSLVDGMLMRVSEAVLSALYLADETATSRSASGDATADASASPTT